MSKEIDSTFEKFWNSMVDDLHVDSTIAEVREHVQHAFRMGYHIGSEQARAKAFNLNNNGDDWNGLFRKG